MDWKQLGVHQEGERAFRQASQITNAPAVLIRSVVTHTFAAGGVGSNVLY